MLKKAMLTKQISVTVVNKIGVLDIMAGYLADRGINIEAISGYEVQGSDKSTVMLVVDNTRRASEAIKERGFGSIEENDVILFTRIPEPDAYVLFSVTRPYSELATKLFPGVSPFHHTVPLLQQVSHFSRNEFGLYVHVHFEKEYFNLLILEHGALKFFNTFNYKNITDILYYVFNTYKNMGISREETINFSGRVQMQDELCSKISRYIKNIKFRVPEGNFSFSYVFSETELHRSFNLLSITNCG